jgi:N-acetylmuramoyl-L-alanine amidase
MVSNFIQNQSFKWILLVILTVTGVSMTPRLWSLDVKFILNPQDLQVDECLSAQLFKAEGLVPPPPAKKFKIVIDAGHGGHDTGAVGKNSKEKDIVLKMALLTRDKIKKQYPDFEVLLTRESDDFIPLFSRIQYANEQNADLFISLHCNYIGVGKTRGTETFVMGLHRAEENLEVAKRENASILLEKNYESNYDGFDPNSPEGHIVLSMYQNNYLDKSIELAATIENEFSQRHLSSSRGVKQAGFAVLRRASMPAVLVEAGFLSNDIDEAYLLSDDGQDAVAESILRAVTSYYKQNVRQISSAQDVKSTAVVNKENKDISHYYRVQIAAVREETVEMDTPELRKIGTIVWQQSGEFFKCQVGDFLSRSSAEIAREKLKSLGYTGAFIVEIK